MQLDSDQELDAGTNEQDETAVPPFRETDPHIQNVEATNKLAEK